MQKGLGVVLSKYDTCAPGGGVSRRQACTRNVINTNRLGHDWLIDWLLSLTELISLEIIAPRMVADAARAQVINRKHQIPPNHV